MPRWCSVICPCQCGQQKLPAHCVTYCEVSLNVLLGRVSSLGDNESAGLCFADRGWACVAVAVLKVVLGAGSRQLMGCWHAQIISTTGAHTLKAYVGCNTCV